MKIFKDRNSALLAHVYNSKLVKLNLNIFKNVDNFDPIRLHKKVLKAYPLNDRQRGKYDITSVKYFQKLIKQNIEIRPIWLIKKKIIIRWST